MVRFDVFGGGDSAVGVFEAGDLRVAGEAALSGSAECCRFSCIRSETEVAFLGRLTYFNLPYTFRELTLPFGILRR